MFEQEDFGSHHPQTRTRLLSHDSPKVLLQALGQGLAKNSDCFWRGSGYGVQEFNNPHPLPISTLVSSREDFEKPWLPSQKGILGVCKGYIGAIQGLGFRSLKRILVTLTPQVRTGVILV